MVRLCVWLALLSVVFIPLERLFALHPEKILRKAILTDVAYYFLSSLIPSLLLSVPLALTASLVRRLVPAIITGATAEWPLWARIAASMVIGEIGFYWGHRLSHEIPFLWRFHAVHHSAEQIDFLVNTRAHPVDMVFTRLCGLVPLYVFGLAAPVRGSARLIPLLVLLMGTVWGFFVHANLRWRFGPLETLVATPAFHHWHHTNDGPAYINKNYAPLLPWIDRLFGTFYLPKHRRPERYGIDEPLAGSLVGQLLQPFSARQTRE
jgi:sterol desaturase/sphingolipid hydroxylase (fatty acid hydroxylase superfamily)